jgi:hypothetical protein
VDYRKGTLKNRILLHRLAHIYNHITAWVTKWDSVTKKGESWALRINSGCNVKNLSV